ncbi:hypothetical protein J4731_18375, partial [Providencia rettgeri]|nr:hypothetical protein [Providencia rettgeri]
PVFGRSKMWWSDASLDGALPQNSTFTGVHLPSLGRVISFRLPCFSLSSLDAHQDKNKAYRPRFFGWSNRFATKQVCDFQRFRIVLLVSLHDVKTHSEARKTVLNFQRRFGCFIG